ncbi:MAG: 16S rRNA (cytosine(1402)-N(4))-methyltransferase RsmH [Alphaproteobacteria bacterium]|nr:16S rRNA (cytosine(1402)-N(4))-methyltransferase RsmH [Alphaproteobacteria bacterium]
MTCIQKHIPVMLDEVLENLAVQEGGVYVDATFGNGGYTQAILQKANCKVISVDRDPTVLPRAHELKEKYQNRFEFKSGCFSELSNLVHEPVDGVVFDIGVSSMQIDEAERGFSFSKEGRLDMRMSRSGLSAYDIVNSYEKDDLANILYQFGEEKKSRQIAQKIVDARQEKPIETTTELAEIIYSVLHKKKGQIDPATRTFQALRIAVNDELEQLTIGIKAAAELLKPNGRLVVVDFHSLEDRIVKNFFKENTPAKTHISRYAENPEIKQKTFSFSSKVITPTQKEISENPRAHSAKLRFAIKSKGAQND